eukprot:CAMPEP_0194256048 /NCGR_PEP_ID=MMETSP0158-20130606/35871_1 /TAXON_ID=33649 /ORGANISM="Thalassionema nitzschioides, Strain L26-B" /LENGTH=504 /DNA_ID=CAMNT_0038994601 /DNA_START=292 /DNA_END=1806 /DNA_ORIENTATION=-
MVAIPASTSQQQKMSRWQRIRSKARKALRMFARLVKLWFALAPLTLLYPLLNQSSSTTDDDDKQSKEQEMPWFTRWYLQFCLKNVEWSGAAVIKLMQWLSSRPDLVGEDFCNIFSRLQDSTTPHDYVHTQEAMQEAFGTDWESTIALEPTPIGSGCIGQVYKGRLLKTNNKQEVAVKVLHPSIENDIDVDLDLLRMVAKFLPLIYQPVSWLNPEGAVEEFGRMLTSQLDLRQEARNIQVFQEDFKDDDNVIFPQVHSAPTRRVLVESFIEGKPILEFAKEHASDHDLLHKLCAAGIRIVCKMIFVYNHCHGDLHPGNIFITPNGDMALLDCGIVNAYSPEDHAHIVNVLTSFIRHDGQRAGRLLMENSSRRTAVAGYDPEGFVTKIDALATRAAGPEHMMEHLGTYISIICNAAAHHHVLMNQSFVSAALAVKVQEGIVLSLDPSLEIWRIANPIILEGEAKRRAKKLLTRFTTKSKSSGGTPPSFPWNLFSNRTASTAEPVHK